MRFYLVWCMSRWRLQQGRTTIFFSCQPATYGLISVNDAMGVVEARSFDRTIPRSTCSPAPVLLFLFMIIIIFLQRYGCGRYYPQQIGICTVDRPKPPPPPQPVPEESEVESTYSVYVAAGKLLPRALQHRMCSMSTSSFHHPHTHSSPAFPSTLVRAGWPINRTVLQCTCSSPGGHARSGASWRRSANSA